MDYKEIQALIDYHAEQILILNHEYSEQLPDGEFVELAKIHQKIMYHITESERLVDMRTSQKFNNITIIS